MMEEGIWVTQLFVHDSIDEICKLLVFGMEASPYRGENDNRRRREETRKLALSTT